jgi:predicted nucleic acid-binding protein
VLVLDSNVVLRACAAADGFAELPDDMLVAPHLMWSEARSALHEAAWRREVTHEKAATLLGRLGSAPVRARSHRRLGDEAWTLADELGWARTYDAEYVALARLLGCRLVTLDARLRRGAERLGCVVGPTEL